MNITVLSQPNCQPCKATKRRLDKHGLTYGDYLVSERPDLLAVARDLGYQESPVVLVHNEAGDDYAAHWSGYRPHMIDLIAKDVQL